MYLPKHFRATDPQADELLAGIRVADLITPTVAGLWATFLPVIYTTTEDGSASLLGHVARKNDHWRLQQTGESLVISHGPEAYISPAWYAAKREHGKVVPTWNYLTAHIYGELVIHDDVAWLERLVRLLTDREEAEQAHPWSVDDAPRSYVDGQLRAIVGLELRISRIDAKAKLGLHRGEADTEGVIEGLTAVGDDALADATRSAWQAAAAAPGEHGNR